VTGDERRCATVEPSSPKHPDLTAATAPQPTAQRPCLPFPLKRGRAEVEKYQVDAAQIAPHKALFLAAGAGLTLGGGHTRFIEA
jgi:hypothetical protein